MDSAALSPAQRGGGPTVATFSKGHLTPAEHSSSCFSLSLFFHVFCFFSLSHSILNSINDTVLPRFHLKTSNSIYFWILGKNLTKADSGNKVLTAL